MRTVQFVRALFSHCPQTSLLGHELNPYLFENPGFYSAVPHTKQAQRTLSSVTVVTVTMLHDALFDSSGMISAPIFNLSR